MERLLALLRSALSHVRDHPLPYWTPSALDPYGVLPVMEALHADEDSDEAELVVLEPGPEELRAAG